jgi:hypothetical protein
MTPGSHPGSGIDPGMGAPGVAGAPEEAISDREWLFAVDESGTKQTPYYGFGALIMKSDRRGDFVQVFRSLYEQYGIESEVKWNRVNRRTIEFMRELVSWFFRTDWLVFHCIVVRKADIDKELSNGDYDLAWRRFLTLFIENKCKRLVRHAPSLNREVRIWCDPIQSRYAKADEALQIIANNMLNKHVGKRCQIVAVRPRNSREVPAIQLCDVLLGAVVTSFLGRPQGEYKLDLQAWIARHLSWPDLLRGTFEKEAKFNIWFFCERNVPRKVFGRAVTLLHPYPHR